MVACLLRVRARIIEEQRQSAKVFGVVRAIYRGGDSIGTIIRINFYVYGKPSALAPWVGSGLGAVVSNICLFVEW